MEKVCELSEQNHVLPRAPIEQEVPVEELERFGLKFENTWDWRRTGALPGAVLLVGAFYYSSKLWAGNVHLGPRNGWNLDAMFYSLVVVGWMNLVHKAKPKALPTHGMVKSACR